MCSTLNSFRTNLLVSQQNVLFLFFCLSIYYYGQKLVHCSEYEKFWSDFLKIAKSYTTVKFLKIYFVGNTIINDKTMTTAMNVFQDSYNYTLYFLFSGNRLLATSCTFGSYWALSNLNFLTMPQPVCDQCFLSSYLEYLFYIAKIYLALF